MSATVPESPGAGLRGTAIATRRSGTVPAVPIRSHLTMFCQASARGEFLR